jgi:transcriptional regulator with XRE-family HTH domain/tetratricopeptide (TPR) repeat protein
LSEAELVGAFGDLRRRRLAAGLTQEELADRTGLSVRAISAIERGRTAAPRPSTQRLLADVLSPTASAGRSGGGPAARRRPPAQLPADLADFTGRREQLELLTGLLTAAADGELPGAVIVSAVAGAGGIGKSALAVHAAHQVAPNFPDGQLYLNLRGSGSQPVTPGEALLRFLRDLGTDPAATRADEAELSARYRSLLAGRRFLIILDDARDAAQVRPLLPGTAGCAVVVTSRGSLPDLESTRLLELGSLTDADALALFARITGPARAAAEPEAARAVLAACGGLPLAIRVAAVRLVTRPGWSVAALAGRLGDARRRLDELQAGDLAVRASFTVSYASIREDAAPAGAAADRAFRMLAAPDGPDISLPAAAALLDVPAEQAERALELLVDSHLLQSAAPGRYRLHDLMRVYAGERVLAEESTPQRALAVHRMLQWYLHTAAAAARLVYPHGRRMPLGQADPGIVPLTFTSYARALEWLDAEYANLVAAVGQAAHRGEHELAWKLPASMTALFFLRGHITDWIATHQLGLASARALADGSAEWWILNNLSLAYRHAKRMEAALDCHLQGLRIVREASDARRIATATVNLGYTLADIGRYDEALEALQESLAGGRALPSDREPLWPGSGEGCAGPRRARPRAPGAGTPALAGRRCDIRRARPPAGRRPCRQPAVPRVAIRQLNKGGPVLYRPVASAYHDLRTAGEVRDHRRRVRRAWRCHQAAAGRPRRPDCPGTGRRGGRYLAGQHLSGLPVRRAVEPVLVLVRAQSGLERHLPLAAGAQDVPERRRGTLRSTPAYPFWL